MVVYKKKSFASGASGRLIIGCVSGGVNYGDLPSNAKIRVCFEDGKKYDFVRKDFFDTCFIPNFVTGALEARMSKGIRVKE